MASLRDLNSFSQNGFAYNDIRPFGITLASTPYTTANITVQEDSSHYTQPLSSITEIHSAIGANVSYTIYPISVGTGNGQTLTSTMKVVWPLLPTGVTQTSNAAGYTTIGNITSVRQWNAIRSPLIIAPDDVNTSWSYGGQISYIQNGNQVNKDWTINAIVSSDASEILTPSSFGYVANVSSVITGPMITNANATGIYTLTITANNTSAVSTITTNGNGSQSWDAPTKTLTLTGTRSQINSRLSSINFVPTSGFIDPISLIYTLTNPSGLITTVNQSGTRVFVTSNRYFVYNRVGYLYEDTPPQFANVNPYSDFRVELTLASNIGIIGGGDSITTPTGWTQANLTYSFAGTYSNCNAKLGNVIFAPQSGTISDSFLTCRLYQDNVLYASDLVNLKGQASTGASGSGNVITITSSTTFTPTTAQAAMNCDVLIIAGGGSGSHTGDTAYTNQPGGGGGAGGLRHSINSQIFKNRGGQTFNINVGQGGSGVTWTSYPGFDNNNTLVATGNVGFETNIILGSSKLISTTGGGGGGGGSQIGPSYGEYKYYSNSGSVGGSGGGGGPLVSGPYNHNLGASGIYGQGYAGANGANLASGGGGGANGAGSGTSGGAGYICNITGANVTYAEGGKANGGAISTAYGSGGNGADDDITPPGANSNGYPGQNGVVIIRFY